jgi:hypothetical protein
VKPAGADRFTDEPAQKVNGAPVITGIPGPGLTTTVVAAEVNERQPSTFET